MPIIFEAGLAIAAAAASVVGVSPPRSEASFTIMGIVPVRCSASVLNIARQGTTLAVALSQDCNTPYRLVVNVNSSGGGVAISKTILKDAFDSENNLLIDTGVDSANEETYLVEVYAEPQSI